MKYKLIKQKIAICRKFLKLSKNWCNGTSEVPNHRAVNLAIKFLTSRYFPVELLNLTSIVPIPQGGIGLDIGYGKATYLITFYNSGKKECNFNIKDFWHETSILKHDSKWKKKILQKIETILGMEEKK